MRAGLEQNVRHAPVQRQRIAAHAQAADHADRGLGNVGVLTEFLAAVDIGDVHLDHREIAGEQRVHQGDRGGGVAGRIDHDALGAAAAFLHPGDQLALAVGLAEVDGEAEAVGGFGAQLLDVVERGAAVEMRLAQAEHVHVRAVQDGDQGRSRGLGHASARSIGGRAGPTMGGGLPVAGRYSAARWPDPTSTGSARYRSGYWSCNCLIFGRSL